MRYVTFWVTVLYSKGAAAAVSPLPTPSLLPAPRRAASGGGEHARTATRIRRCPVPTR